MHVLIQVVQSFVEEHQMRLHMRMQRKLARGDVFDLNIAYLETTLSSMYHTQNNNHPDPIN